MATYGCVEIAVAAGEDAVKKIYEQIHKENGYFNTRFILKFVGFEAPSGTSLKINGIRNVVPSSEYFISPYNGSTYMNIQTLTFDEDFSGNIYYII